MYGGSTLAPLANHGGPPLELRMTMRTHTQHRHRADRGSAWVRRLIMAAVASVSLSVAAAPDSPWQVIAPGGDTLCATGTPYHFSVRNAAPDKLMVFFNGGGACWSAATCDPANNQLQGPMYYRPFATAEWGNDPAGYDGAFALANPENPFRDWSQVFVSYCSGDVHLGANDKRYTRDDGSEFTIHHRGRSNAQAALDYIYGQFPRLERIFVAGGSAGAISSPFYAAMIARHYPQAKVIQFGGGGGAYSLPAQTVLWRNWGVFTQLPGWVDTAKYTPENLLLTDLYPIAAAAAPRLAFHQYDNAHDAVQGKFQALLSGEQINLLPGLDANRAQLKRQLPDFHGYTAAGNFHTLLRYPELYSRSTDGVRAVDWIRSIVNGEPVADVHCIPDNLRAIPTARAEADAGQAAAEAC